MVDMLTTKKGLETRVAIIFARIMNFQGYYGPLGDTLADSLSIFSLDIVKEILGYLVYGLITRPEQKQKMIRKARGLHFWNGLFKLLPGVLIFVHETNTHYIYRVYDVDDIYRLNDSTPLIDARLPILSTGGNLCQYMSGPDFMQMALAQDNMEIWCFTGQQMKVYSLSTSFLLRSFTLHMPYQRRCKFVITSNRVYIPDPSRGWIWVLDRFTGKQLMKWTPEYFEDLRDIAISEREEVFILDSRCIFVFNDQGVLQRCIGNELLLLSPTAMCVDRHGMVYVTDCYSEHSGDRVVVLYGDGRGVLRTFGRSNIKSPTAIHIHPITNSFFVEESSGDVCVFGFYL